MLFSLITALAAPPATPSAVIQFWNEVDPKHHKVVLGALPASKIDRVIKKNLPSLRRCYQHELAADPSLEGSFVVKFTIGDDGTVTQALKKGGDLEHADVEDCVLSVFDEMQFPQPIGGGIVLVAYPFLFSPG